MHVAAIEPVLTATVTGGDIGKARKMISRGLVALLNALIDVGAVLICLIMLAILLLLADTPSNLDTPL